MADSITPYKHWTKESLPQQLAHAEHVWRRCVARRDEANEEIHKALEQLIELSGQRIVAEARLPRRGWQLHDERSLRLPEYPWKADAVLVAASYYSARVPLRCPATHVVATLLMGGREPGLGLLFATAAELVQFCAHQQLHVDVTAFRTENTTKFAEARQRLDALSLVLYRLATEETVDGCIISRTPGALAAEQPDGGGASGSRGPGGSPGPAHQEELPGPVPDAADGPSPVRGGLPGAPAATDQGT